MIFQVLEDTLSPRRMPMVVRHYIIQTHSHHWPTINTTITTQTNTILLHSHHLLMPSTMEVILPHLYPIEQDLWVPQAPATVAEAWSATITMPRLAGLAWKPQKHPLCSDSITTHSSRLAAATTTATTITNHLNNHPGIHTIRPTNTMTTLPMCNPATPTPTTATATPPTTTILTRHQAHNSDTREVFCKVTTLWNGQATRPVTFLHLHHHGVNKVLLGRRVTRLAWDALLVQRPEVMI